MIAESQFFKAMKESGVKKIAVIDDAFDVPVIGDTHSASLLEFLEEATNAETVLAAGIDVELSSKAIVALGAGQYDDLDLENVVRLLYRQYMEALDKRFDPSGIFNIVKGANLTNILPLLTLLKNCDPQLQIVRIGAEETEAVQTNSDAELIFVDFYLDKNLSATENTLSAKSVEAKMRSLARLKEVIGEKEPKESQSVVLMSSHKVRSEAERFREEIGTGKVFASRFGFIEKTQVTKGDDGSITIAAEAGNTLLDIIQSFEFGRALTNSLEAWLAGASTAISKVRNDIDALSLKDFAYLVRFRLAEENVGLEEYLEWFFGECLLDAVSTSIDRSGAGVEGALDRISAAKRIEGAFDGPTEKVAELYHRVRVEEPRTGRQSYFRLGDLYLVGEGKPSKIAAVMTPDCDLIERDGGRSSPSLLLVHGNLKTFDAPATSVADYVIIGNEPYNISWNTKALSTHPFDKWPAPGASDSEHKFIGTLRPLYAQELQRRVLADLGRVGLSVAPAIGLTGAVTINIKEQGGARRQLLLEPEELSGPVYVVPSRGGDDKTKVIFKRQFVYEFTQTLLGLDHEKLKLHKSGISAIRQLADYPENRTRLHKMHIEGVPLDNLVDLGIFVTGDPKFKSGSDGPWCWITVSMPKASL
ncbi:hypothetical protein [Agrobacterium tumefaciens]|uniref:hypothetical protein n=1 Tax=Agrobacterium tumefaciens TaxID=358 RepID=UPI001CBC0532|nr:hypothetical protein [Agrobacterium tumefaciens]